MMVRMRSRPAGRVAPQRAVGIRDIARALGVSIGTVDRALHDKPDVSPSTRARVLAMAKSLDYRPNLAARHLKSPKVIRISVHLPREIALFWDSLREGIREAAAVLAPPVQIDFQTYPKLGEGDVALFEEALKQNVSGLIISPGDPLALKPYIGKAVQAGIAVACVVTDAPDTDRLTSVSADPFTVGAVAGELLSRFLSSGGPVAFFTGWLGTQDHADKLRGFESGINADNRGVHVAEVIEAHDDERVGYRRARQLLEARPDIKGIYVSTVNSLPVLLAIEKAGRSGQITVITTDMFSGLIPFIRRGAVSATVYQRPLTQGQLALQALYRFLLEGVRPPSRIEVAPHIVMRSNLDLFLARLRVDDNGLERSARLPAPRTRARSRS